MAHKYTSQVLLQYLIQKHKVNVEKTIVEMNEFYSQDIWELKVTKHGRVTEVKLKEGMKPAPLKKPKVKPMVKPKPPTRVIIKKRRTYTK
jgi:hypothetical protein